MRSSKKSNGKPKDRWGIIDPPAISDWEAAHIFLEVARSGSFRAAAQKLGVDLEDCVVIGDSVWDLLAAQRARAIGVALLCGGYGEDELLKAGAYRVYRDPADLLAHLDELGIRTVV